MEELKGRNFCIIILKITFLFHLHMWEGPPGFHYQGLDLMKRTIDRSLGFHHKRLRLPNMIAIP